MDRAAWLREKRRLAEKRMDSIEGWYYYYPSIKQVKQWIHAAAFDRVQEAEGDGYYHLLVVKHDETDRITGANTGTGNP